MSATVDNSATAWARKLIRNGADPHTTAAWMRHELDADPLAFGDLTPPAETQRAAMPARVEAAITAALKEARHAR